MEATEIDLCDPDNFVAAVPHEQFTFLRQNAPLW